MTGEKIRVIYRREGASWWAESPDVEGWSAVAADFASLRHLAVEGVSFALGREVELEHLVPRMNR
jgi:predicted RNase H-like HicB family nuclease